jgi:alpha-1,6-mannosyltransferase
LGPLTAAKGQVRGRNFWAWAALGFLASVGLALTGSVEGSIPAPGHASWWFAIARRGSTGAGLLFYLSVALLLVAWLGLGHRARSGFLTPGRARAVLAMWALPLVLGPPLFSRDLYSYVSQGLIAHAGLNPYAVGPSVLGPGPLLGSVAAAWRHTPAPYGPLFVTASRWLAALFGTSLTSEILAQRALEMAAVALMTWSLPRLARNLGADPGRALWLGVLSPLALFSFVASGHNDALMLGLLVTGLALITEQRLVGGLVLCSLAATVKLPAVLALVFIAVAQLRDPNGRRRLTLAAMVGCIPVAVIAAVTWACGLGWRWLSPDALRVPAQSRDLPTPSVAIGTFVFHFLHLVRVHVGLVSAISASQGCCLLLALAATIGLATRVRTSNVVTLLGLALILIVMGGPSVWPWYLMWGVLLLAPTTAQRSKALVVTAGAGMLIVGPAGAPVLVGDGYIVVLVAGAAALWWLVDRRFVLRDLTRGHG